MRREQIFRAASVVAGAQLLGLPLGMGVQVILARHYGASSAMDAFNIAVLIPNSLAAFMGATATALLVPLVSRHSAEGRREECAAMVGAVLRAALLALAALGLVCFLFSEPLVGLLARGFDAETAALTKRLFVLLLPYAMFSVLGGLLTTFLHAHQKFAAAAAAPLLSKSVIITGIAAGAGTLGISALAGAHVAAAMAGAVLLWFALRRSVRVPWAGTPWHSDFPALLAAALGPLLLFRALDQVNTIVPQAVATHFGEGSVASLGYAWRLVGIPMSLLMTSLSTVVFPLYSKYVVEDKRVDLAKTVALGLKMVCLVAVPLAIGIACVGREGIALLLERGAFGASDTERVYRLMVIYAAGMLGYGVYAMLGFYFWARKAHWAIVGIAACGVTVNMGILFGLKHALGLAAVPSAMASAYAMQAALMLAFLTREGLAVPWKNLFSLLGRAMLAGVAMAAVLWTLKPHAVSWPPLAALVVLVAAGGAAFLLAARLMRVFAWSDVRALFAGNASLPRDGV